MIQMLAPWPALMVEADERILIVTDMHLGIEYELAKNGISIPYQTERFLAELVGLVEQNNPDRLLMLGDVKHGVPRTSFQERKEIPLFFNRLLDVVDNIDVTRGNHDGNLQKYLPEEVNLHSSKGVIIGSDKKIAAYHGHAWPHPQILGADLIISGHNHPTVLIPTTLGLNVSKRAWIRGQINGERIANLFLELEGDKEASDIAATYEAKYGAIIGDPEMIIMPTFNDLLGGLPVNSESPTSLLGPLLGRGAISIDDFDVYLLDGTYLGKVGLLKDMLDKEKGSDS